MGDWLVGLMRHAKSDWANENLSDHERPLNARGRHAVPQMAKWIEENSAVPELILASTARRVQETVELMLPNWKVTPFIFHSHALYGALPQTIIEHIVNDAVLETGQRPKRVLVIGHNPGIEELVRHWSGHWTAMPTAAVALFNCPPVPLEAEAAWQPHSLIALGRPKEID